MKLEFLNFQEFKIVNQLLKFYTDNEYKIKYHYNLLIINNLKYYTFTI